MKRSISIAAVITLTCTLVYAGVGIGIKCSAKKCGYESEFRSGTGMASTIVSGYCLPCKKIVSVGFDKDKVQAVAQVWNSATGEILDLYECPECKKPFAEAKHIAFCPKCNQKTASTEITSKWD